MKAHPLTPKHRQRQRQRLNRLQRWWKRHRIYYKRTVESVPFDWSDPAAGCYPIYQHDCQWHGRTTTWVVEQRHPRTAPNTTWNSEHLAYWFGKRTTQSGTQGDGQEVDLDVYTLESAWLGTHYYAD